jgi:hypothetical protein
MKRENDQNDPPWFFDRAVTRIQRLVCRIPVVMNRSF